MKVLMITLALVLAACGSKNSSPTAPVNTAAEFLGCQTVTPGSSVTLHSFGDSITVGSGAGANWPSVTDNCDGYQTLISQELGVNSDNEGIGGTLMVQTHFDLMMAVQENPQDINTIFSGFNDITNFGGDADHLNQFISDLTLSITRLRAISSAVYVGNPLRVPMSSQTSMYLHTDANVALYGNAIQQVVQGFNDPKVVFVDVSSSYDPDTMVSVDGYHPSTIGHQAIAAAFYNAMK